MNHNLPSPTQSSLRRGEALARSRLGICSKKLNSYIIVLLQSFTKTSQHDPNPNISHGYFVLSLLLRDKYFPEPFSVLWFHYLYHWALSLYAYKFICRVCVRSWEGMVGPSLVITRITSHKYSARNYDNFRGITPPRLPGVAWLRGHCPAHTTLEMCPLLQTESCMEPSHSSHSKNYAIATTSPSTMLTWLFNHFNSPASIEGFIYFEGCPKIHLV